MTNSDFLALEAALGLLTTAEKQAIQPADNFNSTLIKWQLNLNRLNAFAPLEKPASRRIWQAINLQIKPQKTNLIATWLQAWKYALSGFAGLGMLISISLFHQTANAKFGWNVNTNLSKQQITLTATTHQHADFSKVCTLWIKNGEKILLIGSMPETGEKTFKITQKLGKMIKGGELIISIENKQNQGLSPTIIEYQQEWKS